jgi:excinuclease ABC subunit C
MDRRDGHRYFGPYTSVWAVHQTLDILRKIFPYLTCDRTITGQDPRACLYYDIKLCIAPCIGASTQAEYRAMIDDLCRFLQGRTEPVAARLRANMQAAAERLEFEKAAAIRDQLGAIDRIVERQKVVSTDQIDSDVIAFARANGDACVQVFFIRAGKMIGREYFVLEGTENELDQEIVTQFVKQFYDEAAYVPPEVLLPEDVAEAEVIQQWLKDKRGGDKVALNVPRRGQKRELVSLAAENASDTLAMLRAQWAADTNKHTQALAELQAALGLPEAPTRIECFDISNTQGTAATASMVVFAKGAPYKKDYRRFTIRSVTGPDDYASMREVLTRRFRRWQEATEGKEGNQGKAGNGGNEPADGITIEAEPSSPSSLDVAAPGAPASSWSLLPDLLIVDGGKGQLGVAVEVLQAFGLLGRVPVAGLAKQQEELFLPGRPEPVRLPRRSEGLYLIQRVRDEAHRFALQHHRTRRAKAGVASRLDSVPGIGPTRRKALLKHFGSLEAVRAASLQELAAVKGMTREAAAAVKASLE